MDMETVLFLDIDGVLNSEAWLQRYLDAGQPLPRPPLDPLAVARLERIIRETGARIVLSTSWRGHPELPGWLRSHGCTGEVIGVTPYLGIGPRGREITRWLERAQARHEPIGSVCILDDGDDMGDLRPYLVQTDPAVGLQDGDVDRAIALLRPGWVTWRPRAVRGVG